MPYLMDLGALPPTGYTCPKGFPYYDGKTCWTSSAKVLSSSPVKSASTTTATSPTVSIGSKIWGGVTSTLSFLQSTEKAKAKAAAYGAGAQAPQAGGMPPWLLPVGIGLAAVALVVVLKKK